MARRWRRDGRQVELRVVPRSFHPLIRLWLLRLLVPLGGQAALLRGISGAEAEILRFAGVTLRTPEDEDPKALRSRIAAAHQKAEARGAVLQEGSVLARNLAWVSERTGLSAEDQAIFLFVLFSELDPSLGKMLELMGNLSAPALEMLLSRVLDLPARSVREALDSKGALARSGLVSLDLRNKWSFENKFSTLPGAQRLLRPMADRERLFAENFVPSGPPTLSVEDYGHVAQDLAILEAYLADSLESRRPGVNILLHGSPGTGKTELAHVLAARLGVRLFEVATEDAEGAPVPGRNRIQAYRLSQALLGRQPGRLVLLDEIEDVFRAEEPFGPRPGRSTDQKAWVNKLLETNPVPAFWITNNLRVLDPAFIRRFDYVLELGVPPRSARRRILAAATRDLALPEDMASRLAGHEHLAPALVTRAAKVARQLQARKAPLEPPEVLARTLGNTLQALGWPLAAPGLAAETPRYRLEALNADADLEQALTGLKAVGAGRLCLYGPPGTGKSAFGRHISEALDRPLVVRRASDLISPFVGMTEQQFAQAFREALDEQAVLLLDEADSFLQDRGGAQRSWEVTMVNEMLTQIEAFPGVFIATTNLIDSLDPAALRRFDLRIRFGYLKPRQAWEFFRDTSDELGLSLDPGLEARLGRLAVLTPGDFATVRRQARLQPVHDSTELLSRLQTECAAKSRGQRAIIGFAS